MHRQSINAAEVMIRIDEIKWLEKVPADLYKPDSFLLFIRSGESFNGGSVRIQ